MKELIKNKIEELRTQNRYDREFIEMAKGDKKQKKLVDNTQMMVHMRSYTNYVLEDLLKEIEKKKER